MATSSFSNIDEYGFRRSENFDYEQYEKYMSSYLTVLAVRSKKWEKLLRDSRHLRKGRKLKRYVRKGIPSSYRAQNFTHFYLAVKITSQPNHSKANRDTKVINTYQTTKVLKFHLALLNNCEKWKWNLFAIRYRYILDIWLTVSGVEDLQKRYGNDLYSKRLNCILDSDIVQAIRTDLPRTFPDNIYFIPLDGYQEQLYRILFAYAADNSNVGYCQGLNYIAGLLLLVTKDENTTFWLLKVLVENILPDYYSRRMTGLMTDIEVFSRIIRSRMPDLHRHIKTLNIPWSLLVMKWFVCLFAEVFPTETVLRIWDCLFYERSRILFAVGLTVISHFRKNLLECDSFTSFIEVFKKMPHNVFVLDCHYFMKRVINENRSITNSLIDKLRQNVTVGKK